MKFRIVKYVNPSCNAFHYEVQVKKFLRWTNPFKVGTMLGRFMDREQAEKALLGLVDYVELKTTEI